MLYIHFIYTDLEFKCPLLSDKEQGIFYNQRENQEAVNRKLLKQAMNLRGLADSSKEISQVFGCFLRCKKVTSLKGA